jgi:hypothetical protein
MPNVAYSFMFFVVLFFAGINYPNPVLVEQPAPLVIDSTTSIQPIVENIDIEKKFHYTRTVKFYYKDPMPNPITLSRGDKLRSYCSDSTLVTFITDKDTVTVASVKRMSCQILAVINFKPGDVSKLLKNPVKTLVIKNCVTENSYTYKLNTDYFQKHLIE